MSRIAWNASQRRIIDSLSGNLVVSASAGSGKTAVMLERIMNLLSKKISLTEMLILAYNIAIASEIKSKLRETLEAAVIAKEGDYIFLSEQLDNIDCANICTIDSYCSGLIKEYFEVLELDPGFTIMSQIEQKSILSGVIKSCIDIERNTENSRIYSLIQIFDSVDKLTLAIMGMIDFVAVLPSREEWLERNALDVYRNNINDTQLFKDYRELFGAKASYIIKHCNSALELCDGKRKEQLEFMIGCLGSVTGSADFNTFRMTLLAIKTPTKIRISSKEIIHEGQDRYAKAQSLFKEYIKKSQKIFQDSNANGDDDMKAQAGELECLISLVLSALDKYRKTKVSSGKFDFSDLTYWAIQLLKRDNISEDLKSRYKSICVDEFQDANYSQEYILSRICDNNLFVVGDTKQCIYKFRLVEPEILSGKFEDITSGAKSGLAIRLNENYRSDERVINFINDIFSEIMNKELTGVDYEHDEALNVGIAYEHSSEADDSCEVSIFEGDAGENSEAYDFNTDIYDITTADDAKRTSSRVLKEGEYVADKIKETVGTAEIYDSKSKSWRKVEYSDIAILAKSRTARVAKILDVISGRGIPIDIAELDKSYGNQFISALNNMLKVIDNDKQDIPLAIALRSVFGGMSYADIADIRAQYSGEEFFYEACLKAHDGNGKLVNFYRIIDKARVMLATKNLYEVACWLVYECDYYNSLGLQDSGDQTKFLLKQFLENIKAASLTLSEFLCGMDKDIAFDYEPYSVGNVAKSVTTSTVHGSKGLEFPIVFLIDCGDNIKKTVGNKPENKLVISRKHGIMLDNYDSEKLARNTNVCMKLAKEFRQEEEQLAAMRLFYVAMTRARNHLFISGSVKKIKSDITALNINSFLEWILLASESRAISSKIHVYSCEAMDRIDDEKPLKIGIFDNNCGSIAAIDNYVNYDYPHKNIRELGIKYTVTEINEKDAYEDEFGSRTQGDEIGVDRAKRGTDYHLILEHIDYNSNTLDLVESELMQMAQDGIIPEDEFAHINRGEIVTLLNSDIMKYAAKNRCLREKRFMLLARASDTLGGDYGDEEILIQGAIDLVILGDEICVVDFKKSRKSVESVIKTYSKQLELYKIAVEEALGVKVAKKIIYLIGANREIALE